MWQSSSYADKLRANVLKQHSVNFQNETTGSNDANTASKLLSNSIENGSHCRQMFVGDPVNDDFHQTACHVANVTSNNSSFVSSSYGKTIHKTNENNLIS